MRVSVFCVSALSWFCIRDALWSTPAFARALASAAAASAVSAVTLIASIVESGTMLISERERSAVGLLLRALAALENTSWVLTSVIALWVAWRSASGFSLVICTETIAVALLGELRPAATPTSTPSSARVVGIHHQRRSVSLSERPHGSILLSATSATSSPSKRSLVRRRPAASRT